MVETKPHHHIMSIIHKEDYGNHRKVLDNVMELRNNMAKHIESTILSK